MSEEKEKKTSKNSLLVTVAVALIVAGIGFFAGMKYQQAQSPNSTMAAFREANGDRAAAFRSGQANGFRPVNGEIISADEKSITVKLSDGSSKIVLFSDSTNINKAENGSAQDLKEGETVAVFGTQNSDGTVSAENIQLGAIQRSFQLTPEQSQ